jgi:hypothetical protein
MLLSQLKENITIVAIRIRKLLLLIILALNLHILFMQSSWQQFLRSLRMHTPPQRYFWVAHGLVQAIIACGR